MRIHITGGEGFLGRYFVSELGETHSIEVSDRRTLDVTNFSVACAAFAGSEPDLVIHLAALCGAQPSRENPARFFEVNALGTVNVLEACRLVGVPRVIFASSLTVFGSGNTAVHESSPYAPRHPYSLSKVSAEFAVRHYCEQFGLSAIVLRPTLVIGEGCKEPHAVGDFVRTVLAGEDIQLFGDGSHRRDFVHPSDIARGARLAIDRLATLPAGACESYNLSNGEAWSIRELADFVVQRAGRGRVVCSAPTNQTFSLFTGIERAWRLLGYVPRLRNADLVDRLLNAPLPHRAESNSCLSLK